MRVPLLDLRAQYETIRAETEAAVREVFERQDFVLGDTVERFERAMEAFTGSPHAISVASGSDALLLALLALDAGPDDTVLTTPFTFFATAGAPARLRTRIAFADIDPETFNLSATTVAAALAGRRREGRVILLPVHLYGRAAPMEELVDLADRIGAPVVEDAAQAVGARFPFRGGMAQAGTAGDFGALSFFPSKNLGGAGDGGMILARDEMRAARVRMLRVHGSRTRYEHDVVGINSRLDALQAAVLEVKLRRLEEWNARRRDRAALYGQLFADRGLVPAPVTPPALAGEEHVFHQYVIRAERRDELRAFLTAEGIGNQIYYPLPLYRQPCFADLGLHPEGFPEAERATREVLALPIFPELRDEQVETVVGAIARFYAGI